MNRFDGCRKEYEFSVDIFSKKIFVGYCFASLREKDLFTGNLINDKYVTIFPGVAADYSLGVVKALSVRVPGVVVRIKLSKCRNLLWCAHHIRNYDNSTENYELKDAAILEDGASRYTWQCEGYEAVLPVFSLRMIDRFYKVEHGGSEYKFFALNNT